MKVFPFDSLAVCDLVIDAVYAGGTSGSVADDPLVRLLPGGNQGGFRFKNDPATKRPLFIALYSDFADPDWPDAFYPEERKVGLFWR